MFEQTCNVDMICKGSYMFPRTIHTKLHIDGRVRDGSRWLLNRRVELSIVWEPPRIGRLPANATVLRCHHQEDLVVDWRLLRVLTRVRGLQPETRYVCISLLYTHISSQTMHHSMNYDK